MAAPTPRQVYDEQQKETRRLVRVLATLLAAFLGLPVTPKTVRDLAKAIFPEVVKSRGRQEDLARRVYEAAKADAGLPEPIKSPETREYTLEGLEKGIDEALKVSGNESLTARDLESVANTADMHSRNAFRNRMTAYSVNDDDVLGWARVDPVPPTCEFCRLLISRGPVYKTAKTAGDRNRYHKGCTCVPQLVFRGQRNSWPGREMYLAELERYKQATKGKRGKEARRAWRDAVNRANGRPSAKRRESTEQATKTNEIDLQAARAQLETLRNMNPSSDSAKEYRERQMKVLEERIKKLTRATG